MTSADSDADLAETKTLTMVRVAHSPDSDDAFMFYAMTQGLLDDEGLAISHVLCDIETLNQAAFEGAYEISAVSIHGYAHLADKYQLMSSGASFGDGYGPLVVSKGLRTRESLAGVKVAVPGELTSAHLALRLWQPEVEVGFVPFDKIMDVVQSGEYEAGVVIHEGQLTYMDEGLNAVVDLGAWWKEDTGLPLPLGGNVIRRDIPEELKMRLCTLLRQSIDYALDRREEALDFAMKYARGLETSREKADQFVGMYVNEWTQEYGEKGREAVQLLLDRGFEAGVIPKRVVAEFIPDGKT
jgi:1,4-dihydroxy-6-naphthoate synthase